MTRYAIALVVAAAVACGTEPTAPPPGTEPPPEEPGPEPPDPGPVNVVVVDAEHADNADVITTLANEGGGGEFYLVFTGALLNKPYGCPGGAPCPCPADAMGETDAVTVNADYEETIQWNTGDVGRVRTVVVYSRAPNTAVWTETDRYSIGC